MPYPPVPHAASTTTPKNFPKGRAAFREDGDSTGGFRVVGRRVAQKRGAGCQVREGAPETDCSGCDGKLLRPLGGMVLWLMHSFYVDARGGT